MLDDICLFIHIVQQGGLSGAARYLSLPAATVTRRLQKLENNTGSKLLNRSSRQCVLTQEGEVFYQTYVDLVTQFDEAQQQLKHKNKQLKGKLKVLAPTNISHTLLRPIWLNFTKSYPDIQLELFLSNQMQDMIKQRADIAVRIGPQADSSLYQQKIGQIKKILVASPTYLTKFNSPTHPDDLKAHRIVGTHLSSKWNLVHDNQTLKKELFPRFSTLSNDTGFIKHLVCDHQGIALLPITEVSAELNSGHLVQILPQWQGGVRDIYLVWPSGQLLNHKAKTLKQYLREHLSQYLNISISQ